MYVQVEEGRISMVLLCQLVRTQVSQFAPGAPLFGLGEGTYIASNVTVPLWLEVVSLPPDFRKVTTACCTFIKFDVRSKRRVQSPVGSSDDK